MCVEDKKKGRNNGPKIGGERAKEKEWAKKIARKKESQGEGREER